jgi:hypothetical protein
MSRGAAIRADVHAAVRADTTDIPVRWDDDNAVRWHEPGDLELVAPAPARREPVDDLRVTVDHLAGMSTGRPVVTIRYTAPRELFDAPVEEWQGIAIREAMRRHAAGVGRDNDEDR